MTTVTSQTGFKNAINSRETEIIVANDITLTSVTRISHTVIIKGEPGTSFFWGNPTSVSRSMLIVTASGNVTVESLTLDAQGKDGTLVLVSGGTFTMNQGVVLKNIASTTAQSAVKIGDISTRVGGTFIMNGGLITGIRASDSVFGADATVEMNNDAMIDGNSAAGMTLIWSKLTMSGTSRISGNVSRQSAAGCLLAESEMIMGISEGDAPSITGNQSPYTCGGMFLTNDSKLSMGYGSEISNNYAKNFAGGIGAQDSEITISGNAVIKNNRTDGEASGLLLSKNTNTILENRARVVGNAAIGRGGGIYMQLGADLQVKGNASIFGNVAADGAGLFLNASTASAGLEDSSPAIFGNAATSKGGGAFVSSLSTLELTGQTRMYGNTAATGKGVYNAGILNLSGSPRILDGLYYAEPPTNDSAVTEPDPLIDVEPGPIEPYATVIIIDPIRMETTAEDDTLNLPVISSALTSNAQIQLESSSYISPNSIPLPIAERGSDYPSFGEADRTAWRLPPDFGPDASAILNDATSRVLVSTQAYSIHYDNLRGAENPNPDSYTAADLPLALSAPGHLDGYLFKGWYNAQGQLITSLPTSTTGDIRLTAVWEKIFLRFNGNAACVTNMPEAINIEPSDSVPVPSAIPQRKCYCFMGWSTSPSGNGAYYLPGGVILTTDTAMELYAQWRKNPSCCCPRLK